MDLKQVGIGATLATVGSTFGASGVPEPFNKAVAGLFVLFGSILAVVGILEKEVK